MKKLYILFFIFITTLFLNSCSHTKKVNEDLKQSEPIVPQKNLYDEAQEAIKSNNLDKAYLLLLKFITDNPLDEKIEFAKYDLARTCYYLGRDEEANFYLKNLIEESKNQNLIFYAQMLRADLLMHKKDYTMVVALTYDLLPSENLRKFTKRKSISFNLSPTQKVETLILRATALAELMKEEAAEKAILDAQKIVDEEVSSEEKLKLKSKIAIKKMQTKVALCRKNIMTLEKMSEQEFIEASNDYYTCIQDIKKFWCELKESGSPALLEEGKTFYKAIVELPLFLVSNLPIPAREVKAHQRVFYEKEMKDFIQKTVTEVSKDFANISECQAYGIF
jgi:hypothetical protein